MICVHPPPALTPEPPQALLEREADLRQEELDEAAAAAPVSRLVLLVHGKSLLHRARCSHGRPAAAAAAKTAIEHCNPIQLYAVTQFDTQFNCPSAALAATPPTHTLQA